MVTGEQEVGLYWHHTWLTSTIGTWEELTERIRTLAHITFQSGHGSGGGRSSHTYLMLPCKAHGWSIGRLQQLSFHFQPFPSNIVIPLYDFRKSISSLWCQLLAQQWLTMSTCLSRSNRYIFHSTAHRNFTYPLVPGVPKMGTGIQKSTKTIN